MDKVERSGVKTLSGETGHRFGISVNGIADERVAYFGHMDADLMRPTGFKPALNKGAAGIPLKNRPVSHRRPAVFYAGRHFFPLSRMTAYG